MKISGWGRYPVVDAEVSYPETSSDLTGVLQGGDTPLIPFGLGRSYGDSALAAHVISTKFLDNFLGFDDKTGIITCEAGVSLSDALEHYVPRGWFLPVTPGTRFVTVGGAIASDVHGKNHHIDGSFSDHVTGLKIATVNEGVVECSHRDNAELFLATCGGMGLTGIILEASFRLKPISSAYMDQTTIKAKNLEEALALFKQHAGATYSVAWLDCMAKGDKLGRSLMMLGEHVQEGALHTARNKVIGIPFNAPSFLLNSCSIRLFNELYYRRASHGRTVERVHYEPFFYPLDRINNWNRLYGRNGFVQYQFVVPKDGGPEAMRKIISKISDAEEGSFLSVLKAFGKGNKNYMSFPMEGYTLALDFRRSERVFKLLDELDRMVIDHGGRVYLAKDARLSSESIANMYPDLQKFSAERSRVSGDGVLSSLQSSRLGL